MNTKKKLNALILSIYRDLAEDYIASLTTDFHSEINLGEYTVAFTIVAGDSGQEPAFTERVAQADAIILVVRFLDVLSLEKIKAIYRHLPNDLNVPVAIFLLRDKGEVDFKISCPACGQKLWLRDTDINKRGRCPNCKKPFVILSQSDHLKAQLMLPENVPALTVVRGDLNSFRTTMAAMMEARPGGPKPVMEETSADVLKNATMRIQIQET